MLYKTLLFLEEQLNRYFNTIDSNVQNIVKLENIGTLTEEDLKNNDNIFITLVNISEEFTLKNMPNYKKEGNDTIYRNPPVFLNLFLLFTACMKKYESSLTYLSHLVRFFQGKNMFTLKNSSLQVSGLENFKIIVDIYSPTFEQTNYLWSTLGGKQHPFIIYKARLVELERESTTETRPLVAEIDVNDNEKNIK